MDMSSIILPKDVDPGTLVEQMGSPPHDFFSKSRELVVYGITQDKAELDLANYVPPLPTTDDIRAEASRRMQSLVRARDTNHLEIIVTNATREAVRLLRKGSENWTKEEAVRAADLEAVDAAIEAIRAISNALEKAPPSNYTDDSHWAIPTQTTAQR